MLDETTAVFGDLVRAHRPDRLMLLADEKLRSRSDAVGSLRAFRRAHPRVAHVLVGDGWSSIRFGGTLLDELLEAM